MGRLRARAVVRRGDVALVLLLLATGEAEVWSGQRPWSAQAAPRGLASLAVAAAVLPLFLRRGRPLVALALALGAALVQGVVAAPPQSVALLVAWIVALYSVARYAATTEALLGLGAALASGAALVALGPGGSLSDYLSAMFVPVAPPWLAGALWARHRLAAHLEQVTLRLAREREVRERAAVAAERVRIARELHDVVAHSVSTIVVQAQAGDSLLEPSPTRAREAFRTIEDSARQALVELRGLLGLLREPDGYVPSRAPQPGLADLDELLARFREAGVAAERDTSGDPAALDAGVDLAAFRIVQEALTNALRHGRATRARVKVSCQRDALDLDVTDNGTGGAEGGNGLGLVGMQERVALYGGKLVAGPAEGGGFRVRAHIPLNSPS